MAYKNNVFDDPPKLGLSSHHIVIGSNVYPGEGGNFQFARIRVARKPPGNKPLTKCPGSKKERTVKNFKLSERDPSDNSVDLAFGPVAANTNESVDTGLRRNALLAALVAVAATASASIASVLHAGSSANGPGMINGAVFVGPFCSVVPPGSECDHANTKPYRAHIRIVRLRDNHVYRLRSERDGRFYLPAVPGKYLVRGLEPKSQEAAPPPSRHVVVRHDQDVDVILDYDNGRQ
jgi:hypothetical protein